MIIVMMGATHPHLQASEASALGEGNQRFPRNEGGRGERSEPTLPPAFRRGRNPSPGTPSPLFRKSGEGEVSPPPDLHPSIPEGKKNKFQTMEDVFPSIVPTVQSRNYFLLINSGADPKLWKGKNNPERNRDC